jgi:hypothetical protein
MGEQSLTFDWLDRHRGILGHQPIRYGHRMHKLDSFSVDSLASFVECCSREHRGGLRAQPWICGSAAPPGAAVDLIA